MVTFNSKLLYNIVLSLISLISAVSKHNVTIVVSFDAFHYKFFDKNVTPTLTKLKEEGTTSPYMLNIFPPKTYPNHFTIATGRFAEEHGVIDNNVFDPVLKKSLNHTEELFNFNKSIVPIWTLNEKLGDGRHSGIMMWPGGEYKYSGILPTFKQGFNFNISFEDRVDKILEWILHPDTPTNLVFLYFEQPDTIGHVYGPNSPQVKEQLSHNDKTLEYLLKKLRENNVFDYNLVILSDHGMSSVEYDVNIINLDHIVNDTYKYYGKSPTLQIYPNEGKYDSVLNAFKTEMAKNNTHFRIFEKKDIPEKWRYKNSIRTPPLLLLANIGYVFSDVYSRLNYYSEKFNVTYVPGSIFGAHGYDPEEDTTYPIFIAHGPAFKRNHTVKVFKNVDLYSFFAKLLNITILPNSHSGNFSNVEDIFLSVVPSLSKKLSVLGYVAVTAVTIVILIGVTCSLIVIKPELCPKLSNYSGYNRRRNWNDVEYSALENYNLLTLLSESDDNDM